MLQDRLDVYPSHNWGARLENQTSETSDAKSHLGNQNAVTKQMPSVRSPTARAQGNHIVFACFPCSNSWQIAPSELDLPKSAAIPGHHGLGSCWIWWLGLVMQHSTKNGCKGANPTSPIWGCSWMYMCPYVPLWLGCKMTANGWFVEMVYITY